MKLPRIRNRAKQSADLLADRAFSPRQVTAMVVALGLAVVLFPVGARAAGSLLNTVITDPGGANKAHVDASGNLQVGVANTPNVIVTNTPSVNSAQSGTWNVGINSSASTPVSVTSVDDPGRLAYQNRVTVGFAGGDDQSTTGSFTVPSGKRLVIRYVSGSGEVPTGQKIIVVTVDTGVPVLFMDHEFVPTFTGPITIALDQFVLAQDTLFYADGIVQVRAFRSDTSATGALSVNVSGYLIDCSVGSCNT